MNCREVEEREILEQYVLNRLTESERDAFEQHYFECDSCFEQLQTGLAAQKRLRQPLFRKQVHGAFFGQIKIWAPAFAALVLLLAVGVWWNTVRGPKSEQAGSTAPVRIPPASPPWPSATGPSLSAAAPSLEELARVEAPPYSELVLRGAEDDAQSSFRMAMRRYVKKDYPGAIPGLRAAVKASPQTARFNFYLGACYVLTGQTGAAIQSLHKTISLDNPAYSELAHFYIAKAYLRNHDVSRAEKELRITARLGGSKAAEAAEILHQFGK